jgi:hypothetical protein
VSKRVLVVLAVCTSLTLTDRHIRETEILSGHYLAERAAAAAKMIAEIEVGNWPKILLDRLADARLSVLMREVPAARPIKADVRTLRLYNVHTRESLTITYKQDGHYIPAAMAQLNYFLRDWRMNTVVSMSGETIDRLWELHKELGSKAHQCHFWLSVSRDQCSA